MCEFEGPYRKSRGTYQNDIFKDDSPQDKGISTASSYVSINSCVSQVLVVVIETSAKTHGLASF